MKLKHTVACLLAFALALSAVSCQKSMNDDDSDKVIKESVSTGASVENTPDGGSSLQSVLDNSEPAIPGSSTPEASTPEASVPAGSVPADSTPEESVPEATEPEEIAPEPDEYTNGLKFQKYSGKYWVIGYEGTESKVIIPSVYNKTAVAGIYKEAFIYNQKVTEVYISDGVEQIAESAFNSCMFLKKVRFPNTLKEIGKNAFYYCDLLSVVELPDSLTKIGKAAFSECRSLISVRIGSGTTAVEANAFSGCYKLFEIINHSPNTLSHMLDVSYFQQIVHKEESKLVNIDGYIFGTSYDKVNYLLAYAGDSRELTLPLNYNGEAYMISCYAFYRCDSLTSVVLSNGVIDVEYGAFMRCWGLKKVSVSESVREIADGVFYECTELEELNVHEGLEYIYRGIIDDCPKLKLNTYDNALYLGSVNNPYAILVSAKDLSITSCTMHPDTKYIASDAFANCGELQSVTFAQGLNAISNRCFMRCESLKSVSLPTGIISIGLQAFSNCTSLTEMTIPEGVEKLGQSVFYECVSLKTLTLPDSLRSIDGKLMHDYSGLTLNTYDNALYLGNDKNPYVALLYSVSTDIVTCEIHPETKVIMDDAFEYNSALSDIIIPKGVRYIGMGAFNECGALKSVELNEGLEYIGYRAFYSCGSLTAINLPETLSYIGREAFARCAITSVKIPGKITVLNRQTFYYCPLEHVVIPVSVIYIDDGAIFEVKSITYEGTVEQWKEIMLHEDWIFYFLDVTVHCIDGDVYVPRRM